MSEDLEAKPPTRAQRQRSCMSPHSSRQLRTRVKQDDLNDRGFDENGRTKFKSKSDCCKGGCKPVPWWKRNIKDLTRNYQTAQLIYNELLRKQSDSSMAKDLEHEQESEVFRILDPPSFPLLPSFPKLSNFVGGGLGAGFALATGLLYLLAALDKAMYSERDVELSLKLPVLTTVPAFTAIAEGAGQKRRNSKNYEAAVALKA